MRNVIRTIEEKAAEREKRLELGLEANRDIENALKWWEDASRILCRQASDPSTSNLGILEQKVWYLLNFPKKCSIRFDLRGRF